MARAHTGIRTALARRARRAAIAGHALVLAACGGSAKDGGDAQGPAAPTLEDKGNRVPGVFEFPEGGRDLAGPARLLSLAAVDHDGVLWFAACGGLVALYEGQSRFYDASAGIPESVTSVVVDANNRKWISGSTITGSTLGVLEHGAFRSVLTAVNSTFVRAAANGVVWGGAGDPSTNTLNVRQLSPLSDAALPAPSSITGITSFAITDHDGALWLTVIGIDGTDVYRWADGAWSGPLALQQRHYLQYSIEGDVLWSLVDDDPRQLARVRWVDGRVEQQIEARIFDDDDAFLGFSHDGRQIAIKDGALVWGRDGIVSETYAMGDDAQSAMLGWNDAVFLVSRSAVHRLEGSELTQVVDFADFRGQCR